MAAFAKGQKTVKAYDLDISLINEQAKALGCTAAEVIHMMCEKLRRDLYKRELGEAFDSLVKNQDEYRKFKEEHDKWDSTLFDGLT